MLTKMAKKCSPDQRFIRKRNAAYKIHTLVDMQYMVSIFVYSAVVSTERYGEQSSREQKRGV